MMEHPDDSAPATLRAGELIGKFHGEKAATGPIGWAVHGVLQTRAGRDHAAIEAHTFRRIPFDDVYEMVNRPFLPLYSYSNSACIAVRHSSA
jgi:hypothetical protein